MKVAVCWVVLAACGGPKRLVVVPASYVEDVIALSDGLDAEDIAHGGWTFDDIDLTIRLPSGDLRFPHARVHGQTYGEHIIDVGVVLKSTRNDAAAALELVQAMEAVVRPYGLVVRAPARSTEELAAGSRAASNDSSEPRDIFFDLSHDSMSTLASISGGYDWPNSRAWVTLRFTAPEIVPHRPPN